MTSSKAFAASRLCNFPLATNTLTASISTMAAPPDAMAPAKVPANLPELVKAAFNRARANGDVHFYPTQVTLVNVNSVPVCLRSLHYFLKGIS
jgi:hypothetical protein